MLNIISTAFVDQPQDIDDLIFGDTITVPSERFYNSRCL